MKSNFRKHVRFSLSSMLLVMLIVAVCFGLVIGPQHSARQALLGMDGTWESTGFEIEGHDVACYGNSATLSFRKGTVDEIHVFKIGARASWWNEEIVYSNAKVRNALDVKVLPDFRPWRMDWVGPNGKTRKCIFQIEGDEMVIVYGTGERPTRFDSEFGNRLKITFKRISDEDQRVD